MKILTILLILLQINTFGYGNYSSPYSNRYNSYSSVSVEQTNRKIGYTTNYGNTFGYTTQQTYSGTYNPVSSSSGRPGQPRRSKEHPDPDHNIADWWRMNIWSIFGGDYDWPDYVDPDYWDVFFELYGETDYYDYVWNYFHDPNHPERQNDPHNPWAVPIGDPDFYIITALLFSYFIYIYMKKRRQQFLLYTGIKR